MSVPLPLALIAELTHRCPLQCAYCSNPLALVPGGGEQGSAFWRDVISEAAAFGVLQIHFSGGEPCARRDLAGLIAHADAQGLYTNLITSAVLLDAAKLQALAAAGLAHVQVSIQGATAAVADRIGNFAGGHEKKLAVARLVPEAGMSLTINAVVHRQNLHELRAMIDLAEALGADRLEIAHVQYHGWALENRAALIPARAQLQAADEIVAERRAALTGRMVIDYVIPDYYADRPKSCMGGWGQKLLIITPQGRVLPCHAAETIPQLEFPQAGTQSLREIWETSPAFNIFRGTGWMREPCMSCPRREEDFGGCRCQALALAGDARAADPACALSDAHGRMQALAAAEAGAAVENFIYRRFTRTG